MLDPREIWEHATETDMQLALAGSTPRAEYVRNRIEKAEQIARMFQLDGTQDGFEIGSGEGLVAKALSPLCHSLDCTDVSRTFLKRAGQICADLSNVRFHHIGGDYLDFLPKNHYHFGFSMNVFIHFNIYDIYHYLRSAKSILRPGGLFYFTGATLGELTMSLFHFFAAEYLKNSDPVHVRGYMTWNDISLLRGVIDDLGLRFREDFFTSVGGHLEVVVERT